jgi:predicted HicB family RNase H-like nuclease
MRSVILRVPCDEETHGAILAAAERDDRPMASWIRQAIKEKLEREAK